jgi:2,5-diamino-6-hydroxy-4-(5-phosphoribosylamino)pyrimidine 1'-reductase
VAPDASSLERPFVFANMAMTVDGKITSATREHPRFTSDFDRKNMDRLRARADAVLIGAGTLRADDPRLGVRDPEMRLYRRSLGKSDGLTQVVVSRSADLPPGCRFLREPDGGDRIVATTERAPRDRVDVLERTVEVWRIGTDSVDLRRALARLRERGVASLLVEGGGELNWEFVRDDLLDEIHVTIAPALLGGSSAPTLLEGAGLAMSEQRRLRLCEVERVGDELFCRYEVCRP